VASFNQVNLIGGVTRDPQIKHLPSNTVVAEWGMAMGRKYKTAAGEQREEVCFVDCKIFGKGAEVIGQYVTKGKQLFVSGRLHYEAWDDKQGGGRRSKLSVVVEDFQLLSPRDVARDEGEKPRQQSRPAQVAADAPDLSEQQFDEADIPF
jgi:single-strand DNA-binding protein